MYSCNSGKLVTEEVKYLESGTEANFYREGIRLTKLLGYCMKGSLLLPHNELVQVLEICNLWQKHHVSLPGERSNGHSWCGLLSVSYYDANSDKGREVSKSELDEFRSSEAYEKWKDKKEKLEEELNQRFKKQLSTPSLDARITRFELELKYKGGKEVCLIEWDVKALKDFIPLYRQRRENYA